MEIPLEIVEHELIPYLRVEEILSYCKTNKEFQSIRKSDNLWHYLLMRDYDQISSNPYEEYKWTYHIHKISDISLDTVINLSDQKVNYKIIDQILTKYFGFVLYGKNYEWRGNIMSHILTRLRNMNRVCSSSYVLHSSYYVDGITFQFVQYKFCSSKEAGTLISILHHILPNIFHIVKSNGIKFHIDYKDLVKVYNFYHGKDAFLTTIWNEMITDQSMKYGDDPAPVLVHWFKSVTKNIE